MSKIHVLPRQVADLIAAGEVVERPASVVKELLENAIDAASSRIIVEIRGGGTSFIRVTDDGCGMEQDEVSVAFLRHATSKIQSSEDLAAISTLGFRGEALAAISAVTRIDIMTCPKENLCGTHAHIEGGEVLLIEEAGCPPGTTMMVRDIYYNTPARMKFLKRDATEGSYIEEIVQKIALSHPEISLQFIKDGKLVFSTSGDGVLKNVIYEIFGSEISDSLVECQYEYNGISVCGFVGKPHLARHNRNLQCFFLNGRFIRSKTFFAAVDEAYREKIMVKKYPNIFLHIRINPDLVDINVHPAKLEAKFGQEKQVYDAVYFAVLTALNADVSRPVADRAIKKIQPVHTPFGEAFVSVPSEINRETSYEQQYMTQNTQPIKAKNSEIEKEAPKMPWSYSEASQKMALSAPSLVSYEEVTVWERDEFSPKVEELVPKSDDTDNAFEDKKMKEEEMAGQDPQLHQVRVIGEVFDTYVLAQYKDEVYFVDKHAAHERFIYERLKGTFGDASSQLLLDPVVVTVTGVELDLAMSHLDIFEKAGFFIDEFGKNALLIRAVPTVLVLSDIAGVVGEMIEELGKIRTEVRTTAMDRILNSAACKAAVKAGKKSRPEEMEALISLLFTHIDIKCCPHGRPVAVVLTKYGLEKQFGRIV
jgi:DNA mismatch repair protein MutL